MQPEQLHDASEDDRAPPLSLPALLAAAPAVVAADAPTPALPAGIAEAARTLCCDVPPDVTSPPRFVVSLDEAPETRWNHVVSCYVEQFAAIDRDVSALLAQELGERLGPMLSSTVSNLLAGANKLSLVYFGRELEGISKQVGLPLGKLIMMQLVYEVCACCTSVVVPGVGGVPIHSRTMDWGFDFLLPLTIEVAFTRRGVTVFECATWAGYVGVLTAMRPGGYSVSVNYRHVNGSLASNLWKAITRGWPIGFLLREVCESTGSYEQAVQWLSASTLIAPVYFTVCGVSSSSSPGTLITRNREEEERRFVIGKDGQFIVQTNIDHWSSADDQDIMQSIERRALFSRVLRERAERGESVTEYSLWRTMSTSPVFNSLTVYGCVMCAEFGVLHTRLPQRGNAFRSIAYPNPTPLLLTPALRATASADAAAAAASTPAAQTEGVPFSPSHPPALRAASPLRISSSEVAGGEAAEAWGRSVPHGLVPAREVESGLSLCVRCGRQFALAENTPGQCAHVGSWHAAFSDCNYLKCGLALARKAAIGRQHWGCCGSLDYSSTCAHSGAHEPAPRE